VRRIWKSNVRYWTLFRPKYCGEAAGGLRTASADKKTTEQALRAKHPLSLPGVRAEINAHDEVEVHLTICSACI
jgi:hypothetical protein